MKVLTIKALSKIKGGVTIDNVEDTVRTTGTCGGYIVDNVD